MKVQTTFPWSTPARSQRVRRADPRPPRPSRMAPAAVRIPEPHLVQVPLYYAASGPQIFVHEGARQALERKLDLAFRGPVRLSVTDNRHSMITHSKLRGVLRVRLHMMFLDAPEPIQDALVEYLLHDTKEASQVVGAFIEQNTHRIRACRPAAGPLRPRGEVHDLASILDRVNDRYFDGSLTDLLISWGRRVPRPKQPRTSIKLGSYSTEERLIRIHPVLDRRWVPRYFVSYVVYHELVHHVVPAARVGGRTLLHPPEFERVERLFKHYERALGWERANIGRLLRS